MVKDVGDVKSSLGLLVKSEHRLERYLVGGWNEDGTEWVRGVRDDMTDLKEKVQTSSKRYTLLATGVWSIFLILLGRIAADYIPALHVGMPK